MFIKSKQVTGIPRCKAVVAYSETPVAGKPTEIVEQVILYLNALDAHDMPSVVVSLRLTPVEAHELAIMLINQADKSLKVSTPTNRG